MRRALFFLFLLPVTAFSGPFPPDHVEFFERSVRPVLAERCVECHGKVRAESGLRLDSRDAVIAGGDAGKVVNRSRPEESSLILAVRHAGEERGIRDMPEKGSALAEDEIAALQRWIELDLPWPEDAAQLASSRDPERHWAFQPPRVVEVPGERHPVDHFIRRDLHVRGLGPAPPADPATLVRRLHFVLTGIPPTREEVVEWSARPVGELIDHLLASPRYGERWGRHWLDVARYSDVRGYTAGGRERRFVYAYTYRDWVIRALNEDMPYDRFIQYQLAAEQLAGDQEKHHLAAMGFLTLTDDAARREIMIDDQIDATFRGLMGLTVSCARCHDHKFDPVPTRDYYSLYGIFHNSVPPGEKPLLREPEETPEYRAYLDELALREQEIEAFLEPKLAELATQFPDLANRPFQLEGKLDRLDQNKLRDLRTKRDRFVADSIHAPDRALVLHDRNPPEAAHVFVRGNPGQRGEKVAPRFLSLVSGDDAAPFAKGSGRLELANAIIDPANPLTARVMVNRVWMHHFGEGLVRTPSDFGTQGALPDHPELLDWLADWFVRSGWSLKKLHRLILTSETWRQSSVNPQVAANELIDAENRMLWSAHRRRLDFESMRDAVLAVSGGLDTRMFGRSVEIHEAPFPGRRTLYAYIDRQNLPPVFSTFDFASPQAHVGQRSYTTVATQALFTMNHPFLLGEAKRLAARPEIAGAKDAAGQVEALYHRVFARQPSGEETGMAVAFLQAQEHPSAGNNAQTLSAWQYGHGDTDPATGMTRFVPFRVWKGERWQPEDEYPVQGALGHVTLHRGGGHPGGRPDLTAVARWTAPGNLTVVLKGQLGKPTAKGDGVRLRVHLNESAAPVAEVTCPPGGSVPLPGLPVSVSAGDTLDFRLDPMERHDFDSFDWTLEVREADGPGRWDYARDFSGPANPATPLEVYAQALLGTNEFFFVD